MIFSYITSGIYDIYMSCKMTSANNEIARVNGIKEIRGYIGAVLLGLITCGIYLLYWEYKFQEQQVKILQAYGKPVSGSSSPLLLWILMCVPFVSYYILCKNYNNGVDAYKGR